MSSSSSPSRRRAVARQSAASRCERVRGDVQPRRRRHDTLASTALASRCLRVNDRQLGTRSRVRLQAQRFGAFVCTSCDTGAPFILLADSGRSARGSTCSAHSTTRPCSVRRLARATGTPQRARTIQAACALSGCDSLHKRARGALVVRPGALGRPRPRGAPGIHRASRRSRAPSRDTGEPRAWHREPASTAGSRVSLTALSPAQQLAQAFSAVLPTKLSSRGVPLQLAARAVLLVDTNASASSTCNARD